MTLTKMFSIAGATSIDVTRRGLNKSYGLKQMEHQKLLGNGQEDLDKSREGHRLE